MRAAGSAARPEERAGAFSRESLPRTRYGVDTGSRKEDAPTQKVRKRDPSQWIGSGFGRPARPGWTTTDAMLALSIGAVLAVGSLSLFERSSARLREQRFTQQVAMLAQSVRGLYENSGAPPYGPAGSVDITARLFALGLGTQDSRAVSGFASAYGRALTVTTDGPWFTITSLVPSDSCSVSWQKIPALHGLHITGGAATADLLAPFDAAAQATISSACTGPGPFLVGYRFQ
jgi:hypothetical protein